MAYTHYFSVMGHAPCGKNARTAYGSVIFTDTDCPKCLKAMSHRQDYVGKFARKTLDKVK